MSQQDKYSAAFKAQVVKAAFENANSLEQLSARFGVSPTLIADWQQNALDGLVDIFTAKTPQQALLPAVIDQSVEKKYSIFFTGKLLTGFDLKTSILSLRQQLNLNDKVIKTIFNSKTHAISKNKTIKSATMIVDKLKACGLDCYFQEEQSQNTITPTTDNLFTLELRLKEGYKKGNGKTREVLNMDLGKDESEEGKNFFIRLQNLMKSLSHAQKGIISLLILFGLLIIPFSSDEDYQKTPIEVNTDTNFAGFLDLGNPPSFKDVPRMVTRISITSLVNDITIESITINRGNCKISSFNTKNRNLKFGERIVGETNCSTIQEVSIETNLGSWVFGFE